MKTSRLTNSQSVGVLKQVDASATVGTIFRNMAFVLRGTKTESPSTVVWRRLAYVA